MNDFEYPTLNEYQAFKAELVQIAKAEMTLLCREFARTFSADQPVVASSITQLREHQDEINRVGRLLVAFNLATLVHEAGIAWRPRRVLIGMLEQRFALRGSSLISASGDPITILKALSEIADIIEFIIGVQSTQEAHGRKTKLPKANRKLRELIISTEVRSSRRV